MSLSSMTGLGQGEAQSEKYLVSVEIKALNHRYQDYRFRMGSVFSAFELEMRKKLKEKFVRGSFEVSLNYKLQSSESVSENFNEEKFLNFVEKVKSLESKTGAKLSLNGSLILKSEFAQTEDTSLNEELYPLAREAFDQALVTLAEARHEEGEKLGEVLRSHQDQYQTHYQELLNLEKKISETVKERLIQKLNSIKEIEEVDNNRFHQELVYYLEKFDIHEELNRINIHLNKLTDTLKGSGGIGRKLDFLFQELNRETNTIGSKSTLPEVSENIVLMKVQLEKMREQALNLE